MCCCLFTTLVLLGPRAAILIWWLIDPLRWQAAFDSFLWPFLGFIFLPWTTLMYAFVASGGMVPFDWVLVGLAVVFDIAMWGGGAYGNRNRIPGI